MFATPVGRRLGRPRHHPGQRGAHDGPDRRAGWRQLLAAGVTPIVLGGDHSIVARRAARPRRGARAGRRSCCSTRTPTPGTSTTASASSTARRSGGRWRRACCAPERSLLAGMRGPLYAAADLAERARDGLRDPRRRRAARARRPASTARGCASASATGRRTCRFDIDVLDPAFAPGTGTPEVAGLLPHEALGVPALAGGNPLPAASTWWRSRRRTTAPVRPPRCWRRTSPTSSWRSPRWRGRLSGRARPASASWSTATCRASSSATRQPEARVARGGRLGAQPPRRHRRGGVRGRRPMPSRR